MTNEDAISRAWMKAQFKEIKWLAGEDRSAAVHLVNIAPSAPPQVVHGRWVILTHDEQSDCDIYGCENCKVPTGIVKPIWRFCPNCGALMGGEDDAAR